MAALRLRIVRNLPVTNKKEKYSKVFFLLKHDDHYQHDGLTATACGRPIVGFVVGKPRYSSLID